MDMTPSLKHRLDKREEERKRVQREAQERLAKAHGA
jgi:hypothetical protein